MEAGPYIQSTNSIERIRVLRLLALLPVLIAATGNTGYQYLLARADNGGKSADDLLERFFLVDKIDLTSPGLLEVIVSGLIHLLPVFAMALFSAGIWERIFSEKRNRRFDIGVVYTALLFTLLMPPGATFFHIAFGISFAMVFAHGIFGGEGKSFLNPALVAVAVVQISFPSALTNHPLWTGLNGYAGTKNLALYDQQISDGTVWSEFDWWEAFIGTTQGLMGTTSVLAILVGAAVLIYGRIASWRLLVGQLFGVIVVATIANRVGGGILDMPWYWHLVMGSFAFAAVFIATDPSTSSSTNKGRWVQGFLTGALVVFIRVVNPSHPDSVIPVLLLVSMLVPLIDHIVVWFNIRWRDLRHG